MGGAKSGLKQVSTRNGTLCGRGPRFHNLYVNRRDCLCGVQMVVSAQSLDFLDLVKNCRLLNWTRTRALFLFYGWAQANTESGRRRDYGLPEILISG